MNGSTSALITAIALVGLVIARWSVAEAASRSDVAARLRTLYTLVGALLALRLIAPLVAAAPIAVALMTVASWLPFAGVRLVEQICRRHAPRAVKLLALGGALTFTALALTLGLVWSAGALIALAAYQALMLALMIWLLARGRGELAPAERQTADTFLLTLLLTIPLAMTDFTAIFPDLEVRGGPIALLLLVLATSRLAIGRGTPLRLLGDVALMAAAGGAALLVGHFVLGELDAGAGAALAAGGGAIAALILLIERLVAQDQREIGLVAALARTAGDDLAALLSAHPLLEQGRMLQAAELASYPPASVAHLLDHRVVSAGIDDPEARDAGRDLLDATGSTHLLRVSRDPPRLLAVAADSLAGRMLDDELELAARLIEKAS